MPIQWSNQYNIGMEEIDVQHQKLVQLINRLELLSDASEVTLKANAEGFKTKARQAMKDLLQYTVLHFTVEEVLMSIFDYEDAKAHKRGHDAFVKLANDKSESIAALLREDRLVEACQGLREVYEFLRNWLVNHIQKSDREYVDFFLRIREKAKAKGGWRGLFG